MNAARVLARLLVPWGWCLAGLGAVLCAVPGDGYFTPSDGNGGGERLDRWTEALPVWVYAGEPASFAFPDPAPWHPRAVTVFAEGPAYRVPDRLDRPHTDLPTAADRRWVRDWADAAWGLAWARSFRGDLGGDDVFPSPLGGEVRRAVGVRVGVAWLAGVPLLWSAWRLRRGLRDGWARPAGRWRRAARPWAATLAAVGAAALLLGPGDLAGTTHDLGGDVWAAATVRRDAFTPRHPRFVRVVLDRPTPPNPPPAAGEERWLVPPDPPPVRVGDRTAGVQFVRANGVRADRFVLVHYRDPFDAVPQGTTRTALDLSLWYALLPAALWSAGSLWRSRRGEEPPAGSHARPAEPRP